MERIKWTSFIVLSTVLGLVIQLVIINSVMAQAPNTTLAQDNKPSRIVDSKNNTLAMVDPKTHQIENITGNLTLRELFGLENTTINETLTMDMGNATTNETLTTDIGNATTNVNLTDKFNTLQDK